MNKTLLITAFALCATRAVADEAYNYAPACDAPVPPQLGAPATESDLNAAHDAVTGFIRVSDSYQRCLGLALGKQQDTAFYMHSNVPKHVEKQIADRVAANQRQKEEVAANYNAAALHFKNGTP